MFESLSNSLPPMPLALLGSVALMIVSVFLVERALRLKRDEAASRLALIAPWTHAGSAAPARALEPMEEALRGAELSVAQREFARRLRKFGIPVRYASNALIAARLWFALCLCVGSWFALPYVMTLLPTLRMALAGSAGALGWFLPVLAAQWAARRRAAVVVAGLPDALELLVICAEGGLALGDGIDRIGVELRRSPPGLAEELSMTAADLKILPSQDQALARLAARIDAPIVQSVVTTLSQTMRYGTPFAQAMRAVASEIRNDALTRLEERANKLPTLLTIPMILFILPTIFLIVGGPAALRVLDQLAH